MVLEIVAIFQGGKRSIVTNSKKKNNQKKKCKKKEKNWEDSVRCTIYREGHKRKYNMDS